MERLCTADFVDVPIGRSHAFLQSYRPEKFVGLPDPRRPPLQLRYASNNLVHGEPTGLLPRVARITPRLYRNLAAPATVQAVPFGNAFAFSTEARFWNLTLKPDDDFYGGYLKYAREHYQFPENPVTMVHGPDGAPWLRVDQRSADRRREDDSAKDPCANLPVTIHADRFPPGSVIPKRVFSKINLWHQTVVYNLITIQCSVSYRTRLPTIVGSEGFSLQSLRQNHAAAVHNFFEYAVTVPYNGIFYTFVLTFRKAVSRNLLHYRTQPRYEGDPVDEPEEVGFHTLRVECRQSIELDTFARIATILIDFFAYQHTVYGGIIDEFVGQGPKWFEFSGSVNDHVATSIGCMTLSTTCFCDANQKFAFLPNQYNGLTAYLGIKRMTDLDSCFRTRIFEISRIHFAIRHYRTS